MRILFLPSSSNGHGAVDRRRFLGLQNSCHNYKVVYDPSEEYDIIFCAGSGDINLALRLQKEKKPLIFDYANHYLIENSISKNYLRPLYFTLTKRHSFTLRKYKRLLEEIINRANLVICSSSDQHRYLGKNLNPKQVVVLTDFFEYDFPMLFNGTAELPKFTNSALFWEGQAENLANFDAIKCADAFKDEYYIVTDETFRTNFTRKKTQNICKNLFENYKLFPWSKHNVQMVAARSFFGILPIDKSIGIYAAKPENKLVLMYLLGLPTVVSNTSSYSDMCMKAGTENWLVDEDDLWADKVDNARCLSSKHYSELSKWVRSYALQNYSTQKLASMWSEALECAWVENTLST